MKRLVLLVLMALPVAASAQLATGMILGSAMASAMASASGDSQVQKPHSCASCHVEVLPLKEPYRYTEWKTTSRDWTRLGFVSVYVRKTGKIRRVYEVKEDGEKRYLLPSDSKFNPHEVWE